MLYDLARIDIKIKLGSDPGPFSKKMGPDSNAAGVQAVEMLILQLRFLSFLLLRWGRAEEERTSRTPALLLL